MKLPSAKNLFMTEGSIFPMGKVKWGTGSERQYHRGKWP